RYLALTHSCPIFLFNHPATTEIYTLSLHDALPIYMKDVYWSPTLKRVGVFGGHTNFGDPERYWDFRSLGHGSVNFEEIIRALNKDRKSTRLNSSHVAISYAVFCLKKKKKDII